MPILQTSRLPDFRGLDLTFTPHPITGDVPVLIGEEAIKRSVRNLVMTNFWERPFRSFIGSSAQKLLFDNINQLTANQLAEAVKEVINNFEPRVNLINVFVKISADNNAYFLALRYQIKNRLEPITQTIILTRIR